MCNYFTCQRYCSPCGFNRTKLASDWGAGKRGKLIGKFLELTIAFVICICFFVWLLQALILGFETDRFCAEQLGEAG